ncbi:sodium-dependent transporter [Brachybacterium saurashtrense]|uniref:Sodium-dependent transporter n=1 Tax=Brachybacterium saurashtrense TaxID=556288 RepID=A0A345YQR7_9MICO|nr:sodium-dependent transporter [Brachybacterium saurashtrense]AXK46269.1 sodium-dependent transporter [Brachybacterium saurashtrense]RRR24009.1 sodium-dependent transporter [Brachybacterium saurashtrense]
MSAPSPSPTTSAPRADRGAFAGRTAFIFAAIGSAVGLGNIWRFPAVAYENGGGAFILPYLVALLTAGIPLLFLDYAIGHRWRGSAPAAWRRFRRWTEFIGWWQVLICVIIAIYYALILAWATNYTIFSFTKSWGEDPGAFFGEYTQAIGGADATLTMDIVPTVMLSMVLVWLAVVVVMALGVHKGIARSAVVFIPLLILMFVILVITALTLPGATVGLDAFFRPNWEALTHPGVWVAAYGQIFFSLSVAFGIMLTYSSYLKKKTDLTGSGLVVGFANSSFEILCGIGVFSALGFMAQAQGVAVDEVVAAGVGLAFIAFPAIINEAPAGALIGVLFFGSLVLAGFTSLVSIVEVIIAAFQDKFGLSRLPATLGVCLPLAIVSVVLFSTTSGLPLLDVLDKWVNEYGIVAAALVSCIVVVYLVRGMPTLRDHLNFRGTFPVGRIWLLSVAVVAPVVLGVSLILSTYERFTAGATYEGYPGWFVLVFGWLMAIALVVVGVVLSLLPWPATSNLHKNDSDGDEIAPEVVSGQGLTPDPSATTPHALRSSR